MDIASVAGAILGITLLLAAVAMAPNAPFGAFIDYPSAVMVFGGAAASVLICFPLRSVFNFLRVIKKVFFFREPDFHQIVEQMASLAETARRDGLLALEARIDEISHPLLVMGIQLAVDGTRPEVIESILRTEMEALSVRHRGGKAVMDQFGRFAPAFGMIGTLVGLIMMLTNMADPNSIGPGMAVAMITTLYGAVIANLFCLPFSEKLGYQSKRELLAMEVIVRGIMAIQSGENPRVIEQRLRAFVPKNGPPMAIKEVA
ncbi:MAG: MotA/TolQ/ExbB proton channel family protein [Thermoguttaceae bacterium]|jgi:chemotaxis protein MotA